jgi:hypothetical protein
LLQESVLCACQVQCGWQQSLMASLSSCTVLLRWVKACSYHGATVGQRWLQRHHYRSVLPIAQAYSTQAMALPQQGPCLRVLLLQCSIDGAYFGTTFPHLLLMTYPMYRPPKSTDTYVPRVFGFKLHPSAYHNRDGNQQQRALPAPGQQQQRQQGNGTAAAAAAGGNPGSSASRQQQLLQQQSAGAGNSQVQSMDQDEEEEEQGTEMQAEAGSRQQQQQPQQKALASGQGTARASGTGQGS